MGGKGSGPKPKQPKGRRPDKKCLYCGRVISPGRGGRRVYCNDACKMKAYRERKAEIVEA